MHHFPSCINYVNLFPSDPYLLKDCFTEWKAKPNKKNFMGAFEENSYRNDYLAQARQKTTTKGKHSRISEDEAIPTVLNCTHEPRVGQQTLPKRNCSGTCCTVMVSLSYCFCWTSLQEAAVKGSQCHSTHDLGEPLGNMMETNRSSCHREASR